jgi:hypothetical protein
MGLADVLSVVAIVISFVTFVITIYEQYLKSAKLQLILGKEIRLSYGRDFSDLAFWASVAIVNQGAVDAVVLRMSGQRTDGRSWTAPVQWQAFGDFQDADKPTESFNPTFVFKGWTETLVASSRKAMTNWISFRVFPLPSTDGGPVKLEAGEYALQLEVYVPRARWAMFGSRGRQNTNERRAFSWAGSFTVAKDDIDFLEQSCVADADGRVQDSLIVDLTGASRWLRSVNPTASVMDRRLVNRPQEPTESGVRAATDQVS